MMPLRGVAALVILVDSADAVAHRLRGHVSALGNGNVDVVADAQTGEVGVSRAVAKPRVNVGAADLVSEDRSERAPRVSVDDVLPVVFLGGRDAGEGGLVGLRVNCRVQFADLGFHRFDGGEGGFELGPRDAAARGCERDVR